MGFVTILMIALGLSMDSLAVSLSGGIYMGRFRLADALKLALTMGIFQGGMTALGWLAGTEFSLYIRSFDHWIAFALLFYLGCKMIWDSFKSEESRVTSLSMRTILTLSLATSIDALAVGVSMAFLNTDILMPSLIIGITTFILSLIGTFSGSCCGRIRWLRMELIGGVILIGIGIKILLEHTLGGQ